MTLRIAAAAVLLLAIASCAMSRGSKKDPPLRKDVKITAGGKMHGRYREFLGRFKLAEGTYTNGERTGAWTFYNKNKLVIKGNYAGGVPQGEWKYYRSGVLHVTQWYENGKAVEEKRVMHIPGEGRMPEGDAVYAIVQEMPVFNHGEVIKYLARTTRYPAEAEANDMQGTIWIEFVVDQFGEVSETKIVKSLKGAKLLEDEALRSVEALPRFAPGFQGGVPVTVRFTVPINFKLKK
jgi:TonB family protein